MTNFEKWDIAFNKQDMYCFNHNANGLLWLKTRAICRGTQMAKFLEKHELTLSGKSAKEKNRELFELLENNLEATEVALRKSRTDAFRS